MKTHIKPKSSDYLASKTPAGVYIPGSMAPYCVYSMSGTVS